MKKIILLLGCFMSMASFADMSKDDSRVMAYQELCAKETDPVKRQNYCYLYERKDQPQWLGNEFRKDTALV